MTAGAALGLLISIGMQTYGMLLLGRIPSVVVFLFWPCGFLAGFYFPTAPLVLPAILANALLFGAVAAVFRSSYGYLYCPEIWDRPIFFVPCSRGDNSGDSHADHYQRVDRNWYIYEVFEPQRIE